MIFKSYQSQSCQSCYFGASRHRGRYFDYVKLIVSKSSKTVVRGVTGTHLNVIGQVTIPIEIDNVELHQSLHVTENCSLDLILGVDFLKAQHSQIDFNEGNLIL